MVDDNRVVNVKKKNKQKKGVRRFRVRTTRQNPVRVLSGGDGKKKKNRRPQVRTHRARIITRVGIHSYNNDMIILFCPRRGKYRTFVIGNRVQ